MRIVFGEIHSLGKPDVPSPAPSGAGFVLEKLEIDVRIFGVGVAPDDFREARKRVSLPIPVEVEVRNPHALAVPYLDVRNARFEGFVPLRPHLFYGVALIDEQRAVAVEGEVFKAFEHNRRRVEALVPPFRKNELRC